MFTNFESEIPLGIDQTSLIQSAMIEGLEQLTIYQQNLPTSPEIKSFFKDYLDYFEQVKTELFFEDPQQFENEQKKLYEKIYDKKNGFTLKNKLFLEFLLGLCRFYLSLILYYKFSIYLEEKKLISPIVDDYPTCCCTLCQTKKEFWYDLHTIATSGKHYISSLIEKTANFSTIDFWKHAHDFFVQYPCYEKLATHLVSMQFIPEDKTILGLTQTLHWGGFGGNGVYLEKFHQLTPLLEHRIGYHNRDSGGFNARLVVIFAQLNRLKEFANQHTTALLLQQYPEESTIKILDVGSGPEYLAVADIITNLSKQKRKIELTASEVDVSGINALKQKQKSPDSPLVDVKYLDLNLIPEIPPKNIIADAYDVVTARLVLHQLSLTDIHHTLRFFVTVVAANGFIINPDVGPCRFYQALLVPANNVDREGNVPLWTEHDFTKSAVKISATHSKIAYPLLDSYQGFPSSDIPMYTFIAYKVLVVPSELIAELNLLWKQGNYPLANQKIEKIIQGKLPVIKF